MGLHIQELEIAAWEAQEAGIDCEVASPDTSQPFFP